MALIAIVIALLLEQLRPLGVAQRYLRAWSRWVASNVDAGTPWQGWLGWVLAVLLPAALVTGVHLIALWLGGALLALAWNVAVLYATLGFRQFSHHFTVIRDALENGDEERARQLLAQWQGVDASQLSRAEIVRHVIEYSVLAAHRHVFGVMAWYCALAPLGLGPAGAVLYRNADFVQRFWREDAAGQHFPVSDASCACSAAAWRVMDWLPARLTALGAAIVGSFEEAIDCWRNFAGRFADPNDGVILAATAGAIGVRLGGSALQAAGSAQVQPPNPDAAAVAAPNLLGATPELGHLAQVVGLVWRMVALWLLLLVLLTLAHVLR
ncbi:MAG: CobD/CbiB family protein [Burkholderiaceae bacterium]|jgi:adenosylcobinamide-phosphate synthase|nr:CobD/CbiB family protein [Burkholderiaceae bacterium]